MSHAYAPQKNGDGSRVTSVPGHMFYTTDDGVQPERSYGFSPKEHGSVIGEGIVSITDNIDYENPRYSRTMEISREQFDALNEFGRDPERFGFDTTYKDVRNNCVDFTWAALNHAGIQRTHGHLGHLAPHGVDGKVSYLPALAPVDVQTVRDPMPGSDLNRETFRELPERAWWQVPLSQSTERRNSQPLSAGNTSEAFEHLHDAAVARDNQAFDKVGQDYLQSQEGQAFLQAGQEMNRQQDLAQQQAQAPERTGPVMRMTM